MIDRRERKDAEHMKQQKHSLPKEDEGILRTMVAGGETISMIAVKLRRTRQAIAAPRVSCI